MFLTREERIKRFFKKLLYAFGCFLSCVAVVVFSILLIVIRCG